MNGVYDGLSVVELADRRNQWAGKLLADGGARVIEIEPRAGGRGRWCGPFVDDTVDPDRCLDYWWYNTGKQSVALDVGRPPAQDLLRRLLAGADVFLESTPTGTLRAYGLDHGSVSSNRELIYTSLTDFGQDGPWRDYRMNDAAHLALGGHMASTGYSDPTLTPIGGQGHQAWHMGCVFALHGITLALFDRMTPARGSTSTSRSTMPARSAPSPRYPSGSTTAPPSIGRPGCTPPRAGGPIWNCRRLTACT